ncbi:MAG TPA: hypothetical protein VFC09_15865 [Candidatus Dormibacteraeota bacterium]|nr:hypothetical protein [Candidatus Dormibacteraeota bacterium]
MITDVVLGAVIAVLVVALAAFYRYSHTDEFRHGDLRRASLGLLMAIGPFFGVHPKRVEPEPSTISTPKDDSDDPLAAQISTVDPLDPGERGRPPQL